MKQFCSLLFLFVSLSSLLSCKQEDEVVEKPKVFDAGDVSYSLTTSKIYLVEKTVYDGREHRVYYISDGTFNEDGDGVLGTLGDFQDASFALRLDILSSVGGNLAVGEYPQKDYFFTYPVAKPSAGSPVGHIFMTVNSGFSYAPYYSTDDFRNNDPAPIQISGQLNNGENITVQFEGKLTYSYYPFPEVGWVDKARSCKLFFNGIVQDVTK